MMIFSSEKALELSYYHCHLRAPQKIGLQNTEDPILNQRVGRRINNIVFVYASTVHMYANVQIWSKNENIVI